MTRKPAYGVFLVVMAAGLFVVNAGVSRVALRAGVEPSTLTSIRVTGTLALLVLVAILFRPSALAFPRGKLAALVVAHGLVGVAALQWLYFVAIERLPVGVALLLEYLAPLLVALWARFVQQEAVHNRMWLGLGLALAGLAATTGVWDGLRFDGLGVIAGLGAACCFAAYFLIGEVGVNTYDPLRVVVWSFVVATVVLNVVAPLTGLEPALGADVTLLGRYAEHAVPLWGALVWIVVLGTVIPFVAELLAL
ncbi:MAG TPA: EamA family transporter, partial [Nocardioidaceae bacterium]|nr:EamA family transporter [Nocardioidaceae bacterium]